MEAVASFFFNSPNTNFHFIIEVKKIISKYAQIIQKLLGMVIFLPGLISNYI